MITRYAGKAAAGRPPILSGIGYNSRLVSPIAVAMVIILGSLGAGGTAAFAQPVPVVRFSDDDANLCHKFDLDSVIDIHSGSLRHPVVVVEDNAEVHVRPDQISPVAARLRFAEPLFVTGQARATHWVEVTNQANPTTVLGWVAGQNLLCRLRPLRDPDTGMVRKAIIPPAAMTPGEPPLTAYPNAVARNCPSGSCPGLRGPAIQYIYAERENRILLSKDFVLDDRNGNLPGWVDAADRIIRWNTAFGLRPREQLEERQPVCTYRSVDDARTGRGCLPLSGGRSWFLTGDRLPILQDLGDLYEVAAIPAGTSPTDPPQRDSGGSAAVRRGWKPNQIDVVFVMDGTGNMAGLAEALSGRGGRPGIVQQITSRFRARDAAFRFGFRIYRDGAGGPGGGLSLSNRDCLGTAEQHAAFQAALRKLASHRTGTPGNSTGTAAENFFDGIDQGMADMAGCPENTKLMFVIGEVGYNPPSRDNRRMPAMTVGKLVDRIRARGWDGNSRPLPGLFFIQTFKYFSGGASENRDSRHDRDYKLFENQARYILIKLYATIISNEQTFFPQHYADGPRPGSSDDLLSRVSDQVAAVVRPDLVNRVATELRGGQPLSDIIRSLRRTVRGVPALFWSMLEHMPCSDAVEDCRDSPPQETDRLYVRKSENVVTDVMLTFEQMEAWRIMLSELSNTGIGGLSPRRALGVNLTRTVERMVNLPYADSHQEIGQFVARFGGLPVRERSPLMSFSLDDLLDENGVPDCEIDHLRRWINASSRVVDVLQRGTVEPILQLRPADSETCRLSDKGRGVPAVGGNVEIRPLGSDDTYSYAKVVGGAIFYWIPEQFLP